MVDALVKTAAKGLRNSQLTCFGVPYPSHLPFAAEVIGRRKTNPGVSSQFTDLFQVISHVIEAQID